MIFIAPLEPTRFGRVFFLPVFVAFRSAKVALRGPPGSAGSASAELPRAAPRAQGRLTSNLRAGQRYFRSSERRLCFRLSPSARRTAAPERRYPGRPVRSRHPATGGRSARPCLAHPLAVQTSGRPHAGRGAAQQDLVGMRQVCHAKVLVEHGDLQRAGQLVQDAQADSGQDAMQRWRNDPAVLLVDHQVGRGSFGHKALLVQQHRAEPGS